MSPTEQAHSTTSGQARWFAEEVRTHQPALRADLHPQFPLLIDHDDLVQDAYSRLVRAQATGEVRCVRAYLFTTAREQLIYRFDAVRGVTTNPVEGKSPRERGHCPFAVGA